MRVLIFQPRFAQLVLSGAKTQTIRKTARCKPGDRLSLREWTGKPYRSKQRVLREAVCVSVRFVQIMPETPLIDGYSASGEWKDEFALADGFISWAEMRDWFESTHGLPFDGELVTWEAGE